jgi:hypothetical protein
MTKFLSTILSFSMASTTFAQAQIAELVPGAKVLSTQSLTSGTSTLNTYRLDTAQGNLIYFETCMNNSCRPLNANKLLFTENEIRETVQKIAQRMSEQVKANDRYYHLTKWAGNALYGTGLVMAFLLLYTPVGWVGISMAFEDVIVAKILITEIAVAAGGTIGGHYLLKTADTLRSEHERYNAYTELSRIIAEKDSKTEVDPEVFNLMQNGLRDMLQPLSSPVTILPRK